MGDTTNEVVRQAGATQSDPALKAIQELGDSMSTATTILEEEQRKAVSKIDKFEANLGEGGKDVKNELAQLKTEVLAGFKNQGDRINTLDRRATAMGIGSGRDVAGMCLAALGDEERKDIGQIGWNIPKRLSGRADLPLLSRPEGATLVAHWLLASYKLQKRRYTSQAEETELWTRMERYKKALAEMFHVETAAALTTGTDTLGGHWLPEPVAAELFRLITDNSIIAPDATPVPMGAKTLDLPTEGSSSLSVSWGSENTTITDSVPASNAVGKVTLNVNRLNGRAVSSIEEIQDSPISILNWVMTKLTELAGREMDAQWLEGSGSPFTGLSDNAAVNEIDGAGTNGNPLTFDTISKTIFKARERATRENAKWWMAPETMGKIVGMVDSNGQPIYKFGEVPGRISMTVLGFPVEVHSAISASRTKGSSSTLSNLYFGPPRNFILGNRMGMSWDVSDAPGFDAASVHMRLLTRVALNMAVPQAFTRNIELETA